MNHNNNNNNNTKKNNNPIDVDNIIKDRPILHPPTSTLTPSPRIQNKRKKLEGLTAYNLELSIHLVQTFGPVDRLLISDSANKSYVLNQKNEGTFSKDVNDNFKILQDAFFQEAFNACNMPNTVHQRAPAYTIDFITSLPTHSEVNSLPLCGGNGNMEYSEVTHPFTYKSWKDAETLKNVINSSENFFYFFHKYNIKNAFVFLASVRHEDRNGLRDIEVKTNENFEKECVRIIEYFEKIINNGSK